MGVVSNTLAYYSYTKYCRLNNRTLYKFYVTFYGKAVSNSYPPLVIISNHMTCDDDDLCDIENVISYVRISGCVLLLSFFACFSHTFKKYFSEL